MDILKMIIGFIVALVFLFHGIMFFIVKHGRKYSAYSSLYMIWCIFKIIAGISYIIWFFVSMVITYS